MHNINYRLKWTQFLQKSSNKQIRKTSKNPENFNKEPNLSPAGQK
jgi:hypothetical protein